MDRKGKSASCCDTAARDVAGCRVESLIAVDDRGQMVLPKEVRDRAGIKGGDKLALITWERDGRPCCLSLIRVEEFSGMLKGVLGPMMGDLVPKA